MSYTELTFFDKSGKPKFTEEVENAWRGAMAVWDFMDEKYLPPFIPDFAIRLGNYDPTKRYYRFASMDQSERKKVWELFHNENISMTDKIVLGSTFDWVMVKKENIFELIQAFREFEGESSLKEQADLIEEAFKDEDIIAIGWNQTSVSQNNWIEFEYDEEKEESIGYDLNKNNKHWSLFEEIVK